MLRRRLTIKDDLEFLRQESTLVDLDTDDYLSWINEVKEFCSTAKVYALAPVQIGIPKRFIYIKNTKQDMTNNTKENYDEDIIMINPVIIRASGTTKFLERCASCLDNVGVVQRPYEVEVEYYDRDKHLVREVITDFKATIFMHEYDHLDGILHIDRTGAVMHLSYDETKEYRELHPYEIISKTGEYSLVRKK